MTAPFRLGFQTHLHGDEPVSELYPAIIDLFVAAEELGFDSGWVAQHHFSRNEGSLPSPLVFLAAVEQRTRRIRLGSAVVTLSFDDPVRIAEDAAVLDALAGGRLELGIGSGNPHPEQFAAYGLDVAQRREIYAAKAARLRQALRGEELAPGVVLQPPAGTLVDRIWESPLSVDRVRQAAVDGAGVLLGIGPASSVQLELAREYRAAGGERLAIVHAAFPGESKAAVAERLWPGIRDNSKEYYVRAGWATEDSGPDELYEAMNIHHGTADDIVATLGAAEAIGYATDVVLAIQAHSTTVAEAIAGLEVIAREVGPRIGWSPATTTETIGTQS